MAVTLYISNGSTIGEFFIGEQINIGSGFEVILKAISEYEFEVAISIFLDEGFIEIDFVEESTFILILRSLGCCPLILPFPCGSSWSKLIF